MAPATLIFRDKLVFSDGAIQEIVVWRLPSSDPERPHGLKYSLFYGMDGERIVGYDNGRGKEITDTMARARSVMISRPSNN